MIDMVRVDRVEHEAYKEAAERSNYEIAKACVSREEMKLLVAKHEANYQACLSINLELTARLNAQDLQLADARDKWHASAREVGRLAKELKQARAELTYFKPATTTVPQPAFGKR